MGTLASELSPHAAGISGQPRVYVDANMPARLVTLDRDYLDDRKFPPAESPGVLVLTAPNENGLAALLKRLDRDAFRAGGAAPGLPFAGHKLHVHVDWRPTGPTARPEGGSAAEPR